jgi:hypothetical protein
MTSSVRRCFLLLLAGPLACEDSTSIGTSTLSGYIVLQDAWGHTLTDRSGVVVTVDGTSARTTTGADGAWILNFIPSGTRGLTFAKAGFGTVRVSDQPVVSPATVVKEVALALTPTGQAIVDSVYVARASGADFYEVRVHLATPPPANATATTAVVLVGKTAAVSSDPSSYGRWYMAWYTPFSSTVPSAPYASELFFADLPAEETRAKFPVGTEVFVTAYLIPAACNCSIDPRTQKQVFTNTGPRGNVVRFTIK